jgi:endonuclease/exonuclease/phosphatase family metal-dependent hydrolase
MIRILRNPLFRLLLAGSCAMAFAACGKRPENGRRATPSDPGGAIELRLSSFNLRYENPGDKTWRAWPRRLQLLVTTVRKMAPDVMGVQEGLHGQIADLRASLPDYAFAGIGRDDGRRRGEYSGIFWLRDRFEPDREDGGTFWLSDQPGQPGSRTWGNTIPRVCAWQRLVDLRTGRGFYIFNTHWDHRHQGSREHAALLIAKRIDERRRPDEPVVLLGDFNANEDNPAIAYLCGKTARLAGQNTAVRWRRALLDTYTAIHGQPYDRRTLHFWTGRKDGPWKVDHIFASPGAKVLGAGITDLRRGGRMPSDHYPVWSRIVFPGSPPGTGG